MSAEFEEERLDSPLIVHKVTDASYIDTAVKVDVEYTHGDDDRATLERHRFKKVKKKKKWPYFLMVAVILIAVIVAFGLKGAKAPEEPNTTEPATENVTVNFEDRFKNVITVKGTYLFFEGEEVDGIGGLEKEIKYLDTSIVLTVQDENADAIFYNEEVLPLLDSYGIQYETKFIISSGLKSQYED